MTIPIMDVVNMINNEPIMVRYVFFMMLFNNIVPTNVGIEVVNIREPNLINCPDTDIYLNDYISYLAICPIILAELTNDYPVNDDAIIA